jgi:hypothetical protein
LWAWWFQVAQDAARSPVVAAWFTATGALLSAAVSALVSYLVSRRSVYINAVTVERSKWIGALRGTISKFSGAADRVSTLKVNPGYAQVVDWAADTQNLHTLLSDLTLRLNPTETEALNLLRAAKKLDQAARLHSHAAVILADEIMTRHAQWVLKAEWERVKQEAAGPLRAPKFWWRNWRRRMAYAKFLKKDGSLDRLDQIGTGKTDAELILLRSEMDCRRK